MLGKPLLFSIKPGVVAAWNARTVVIIAPSDGSSTRVRDVATGKEHDVPVDERRKPRSSYCIAPI
jgi:hypothetical protein